MSTGTLGNQRLRGDRPIVLAIGSGGDLNAEKEEPLDFSSLGLLGEDKELLVLELDDLKEEF